MDRVGAITAALPPRIFVGRIEKGLARGAEDANFFFMNLSFEWRQCPDCQRAVFVELDRRKIVDFRHPPSSCPFMSMHGIDALSRLAGASRFELVPARQASKGMKRPAFHGTRRSRPSIRR
jgi:hypothetical protein